MCAAKRFMAFYVRTLKEDKKITRSGGRYSETVNRI